MSAVTKGKWVVEEVLDPNDQSSHGANGFIVRAPSAHLSPVICEIFPRHYTVAVNSENAKLIAEAPAMFLAIGKLLSEGRSYSDETWYALKRVWQDAGGGV